MNIKNFAPSVQSELKVNPDGHTLLHLVPLEGLRGMTAIYVVIIHAFQQAVITPSNFSGFTKFFLGFFSVGHYAVDVFIVLSGFCLMLPVIRNNGQIRGTIKQFFFRRARRILPPYYAAIILSLGLIFITAIGNPTGRPWDVTLPVNYQAVISHIFLIHDLFKETCMKINGPLWSIAVEFRMYLMFPLLVIFWRRLGGVSTILWASIIARITFYICSKISFINVDPIGPSFHYVTLFCLGMLAAETTFSNSEFSTNLKKNIPWNLLSISTFVFAIPAYQLLNKDGQEWIIADILVGFSSMSLLIALFTGRSFMNRLLECKPLVTIGSFSYSLYLVHSPILQVFIHYVLDPLSLSPNLHLIVLSLIGFPCVLIVSYVFFLAFEKPFLSNTAKIKSK